MKKIFLLLLFITGFAQAQIINFPDANFKAKLLSASPSNSVAQNTSGTFIKIDTDSDGEIQVSEAQTVKKLVITYASITDLTGISNFINLTSLDCTGNLIVNLDVTSLGNLTDLNCQSNELATLNITGLMNLFYITCDNNNLTSLDLIGLSSINTLYCGSNDINSLNLIGLNTLKTLGCARNNLVSLDLTTAINLESVDCGGNSMTNINVQGLNKLEFLNCSDNQLTSINLNGLPLLQELYCLNNFLTSLNLPVLPKLKWLGCDNNQINSLDFTGLIELLQVTCNQNQLTSLDFSGSPKFTQLECSFNDLLSINIKNGKNQAVPFNNLWDNNPNLKFVCIDESESVFVQNVITSSGLTNVNFNSYCSFTPGGDYNTITGTILFDSDNNGCDASDFAQPFVKLKINDGTNEGATFDNETGNYTFYTLDGTFTVTPDIENPSFFNFSPINTTVNFPVVDNSVSIQNFCITANGIHPDVEIAIAPIRIAVPGNDAIYQIVYKNKGNQILSGDVNFTYNDGVLGFVSATLIPDLQSTGSLTWNYTNLLPFENRTIYVTLHVNSPTDTPPVNSGDVLDFTATVNPIAGDEIPEDNVFEFHQTVVNSYDPNDKTCIEGGIVSPSEIGGYLHYVINFENIGTAEAENIVVKDVIDETMFDVKSLQIMNSSHPVEAKVTGNVVEFIFKGIRLHGGGHGNILLKIKTKNDLEVGDVVSNKADIFFDYNFPIETNVASTQFQTLGNDDFAIDQSVSIYPNPSNGNVAVKANGNIKSVQLFDIQGRVLETRVTNEQELNMDISKYSNGVYFLKVLTDVGIKTEKLIKN